MSSLKDRMHDDLTTAMKARDELVTATLRMSLTAITNEEVAGKSVRVLTDDDVVGVLSREAKRRREAAEAYDAADRPELAERERAEEAVIAGYLPAQLGAEELDGLVQAAVAEAARRGARGRPGDGCGDEGAAAAGGGPGRRLGGGRGGQAGARPGLRDPGRTTRACLGRGRCSAGWRRAVARFGGRGGRGGRPG